MGFAFALIVAAGLGAAPSARAAGTADSTVRAGAARGTEVHSGPDADAASASIRFYQRYLSGLRHVHCRFEPSCSQYALDAIAAYGLFGGASRSADRLMRCNASASSHYASRDDGRLLDPARGEPPERTAIRAPSWLLPPVVPPDTSCFVASDGEAGDERRPGETFAFGEALAAGGDCGRAETEFRRAAFLAATRPALVWAYRASGLCWFESSAWAEAEERYLVAAMLEGETRRTTDVYWAAVSRFNAGDPAGCTGLLTEFAAPPTLMASADGEPTADPGDAARWLGLAGLCSMRRGRWDEASASLGQAAQATSDPAMARGFESLAGAAALGSDVPRARPGLASSLSAVIPGSGQLYAGRTTDGLRTFLVNGALIWTVVALASDGHVPAAFLVGGITVPFYVGNIMGAGASARMLNRSRRADYLTRSLEAAAP